MPPISCWMLIYDLWQTVQPSLTKGHPDIFQVYREVSQSDGHGEGEYTVTSINPPPPTPPPQRPPPAPRLERNKQYVGRKCQHKVYVGQWGGDNLPTVSPPNKRHGNTDQTPSHGISRASSLAAPSSVALLERPLAGTAAVDVNAEKGMFSFVEFLKIHSVFFNSCHRKTRLRPCLRTKYHRLLSER